MTEDEAKTKWCPMTRYSTWGIDGVSNRDNFHDGFPLANSCIASLCMVWRWSYKEEKREGHSGGKELLLSRGLETGREVKQIGYSLYKLEAVGYCGLAGKP